MDVHEYSPEVASARELDAQGRHDDAINQLATAAQRGDVEATTQLAKRIIVGDRAPRLRQQGIGLLQDAVNMGGAEAAARLAVVGAAGVVGPPDWPLALRLLVLAAERGWAPALGELEVLASMAGTTSMEPKSGAPRPPGSIVAGADLHRLLVPAAGAVLHEDPRICAFPEFVSPAVCDWLIDRARGRLGRALVYDVEKQTDFADDSRTNSAAVFNSMEADLVHLLVQARMSAVCGQPVAHMEAPTVLHYAVGEKIGNHYDFVDPEKPGYAEDIRRFGHRVITFLVYLNAAYEGGETGFPKLGLSHAGKLGEGMFFVNTLSDGQADVRTLHSGQAPTAGEKWVFSQFVRNRPELLAE
jgi:hypothetical protein